MGTEQKNPWLAWAAIVVPAFTMAVTWPVTEGWPLLNRIAVGVAVGLVIFAVVYLATKTRERNGG